MKKIIILHREDLFDLASDVKFEDVRIEHFRTPLQEVAEAEFIAVESNGLFKILKNNNGACVIMPVGSFMTGMGLMTNQNAANLKYHKDVEDFKLPGGLRASSEVADFSSDVNDITHRHNKIINIDDHIPGSFEMWHGERPAHNKMIADKGTIASSEIAFHYGEQMNANGMIVGVQKQLHSADQPMVERMGKIVETTLLDIAVEDAVQIVEHNGRKDFGIFPESLTAAILYFEPRFDDVFKVMFQNGISYFTSTLQISYPELYADIKKECGFWCEDTPLYKDMLNYGCDHEKCMLNNLLKGIFKFKLLTHFNYIKKLDHLIKP